MAKKENLHIYVLEVLFACGISLGSNSLLFEEWDKWSAIIARYVVYFSIIKGFHELCAYAYKQFIARSAIDLMQIYQKCKTYLLIFAAALSVLVYTKQKIINGDFPFLFVGYLIAKYPEIEISFASINYGVGMACSFFEGYLAHIIPSDGARFVGFEENINLFESQQRVIFPVKRLFIVITKSLYCPPDLKHFNKKNKDVPFIEACQSLEDVEKDVAGVKNRSYRNSAYKIHRPHAPPLYLAAECATPLHTLHRVLERKALYAELADVDPQEIVKDFCTMLQSIISKSPDCREKCELVFYDDKNPNENLAEILIEKIREIEPDFENIIAKKN